MEAFRVPSAKENSESKTASHPCRNFRNQGHHQLSIVTLHSQSVLLCTGQTGELKGDVVRTTLDSGDICMLQRVGN